MRSARSEGFLTSFAHRPWVRALALFCAVWLTGCYTTRTLQLDATPQPKPVSVTVSDGRYWTLYGARLVQDTLLVGTIGSVGSPTHEIPAREVVHVQRRDFSLWRTLGAVYVATSAVGVLLLFSLIVEIRDG